MLNSRDSSDLHGPVFSSEQKERKRHFVSAMLLYKQSQLTRRMVPAFDFIPRGREYTSLVMLQTNRQEFFILAVSLRACCFYHTWQRCAILGRGLVGQIDIGLQGVGVVGRWAGDGSVSVCVHLILSRASCGIEPRHAVMFSLFPGDLSTSFLS